MMRTEERGRGVGDGAGMGVGQQQLHQQQLQQQHQEQMQQQGCRFGPEAFGGGVVPQLSAIHKQLQESSDSEKKKGMQMLLRAVSGNREDAAASFMAVTRFVAATRNNQLKKMVQLFEECLPAPPPSNADDDEVFGESLLMSQIIRNELQSANEYLRGARLRNLAKTCSKQIFRTIDECVTQNLGHGHPYVRKNAAMCVYAACQRFGPEIFQFSTEVEIRAVDEAVPTVRKAFILALSELNMVRAVEIYLLPGGVGWSGVEFEDVPVRLAVLHLIRKAHSLITHTFPATPLSLQIAQILKPQDLVQVTMRIAEHAEHSAVAYEAACTLLWMAGGSFTAAKAAAEALVRALGDERDTNIQMCMLDALAYIADRNASVLETIIIDLLRRIGSPSFEVKQEIISLLLKAVTPATIGDALKLIKMELVETTAQTNVLPEYKHDTQRLLLRATRWLCSEFPSVTPTVIELMLDFIAESETMEVVRMVRELLVLGIVNEEVKSLMLDRLIESLGELTNPKALRACIYLLGEFVDTPARRNAAVTAIYDALGPFPLPEPNQEDGSQGFQSADNAGGAQERAAESATPWVVSVRTVILPDGTYGTENVIEYGDNVREAKKVSGLRVAATSSATNILLSVIAVAFTKVFLRVYKNAADPEVQRNQALNKAVLILASFAKFTRDTRLCGPEGAIHLRIKHCLKAILQHGKNPGIGYRSRCLMSRRGELRAAVRHECEAAAQEEVNATAALSLGEGDRSWRRLEDEVRRSALLFSKKDDDAFDSDSDSDRSTVAPDSGESGESGASTPTSFWDDDPSRVINFRLVEASTGVLAEMRGDTLGQEPCERRVPPVMGKGGARGRGGAGKGSGSAAGGTLGGTLGGTSGGLGGALGGSTVGSEMGCGVDYHSGLTRAIRGRGDSGAAEMALIRPAGAIALTGYADPVYAEMVTHNKHEEVEAEIFLTNRTNVCLQNICVRLGPHGLGDRNKGGCNDGFGKPINLSPGQEGRMRLSIKLTSAEAGVVFGYCCFQRQGSVTTEYLTLSDLQIDLLDCPRRSCLGQDSFRRMWCEFEWENKIAIFLPSSNTMEFLTYLLSNSKMTVVGLFDVDPRLSGPGEGYISRVTESRMLKMMAHDSRVMTVNLYCKSIFGEDALLNLSLLADHSSNTISGSIRIRSRAQGIALSLGDRIAQAQRHFAALKVNSHQS